MTFCSYQMLLQSWHYFISTFLNYRDMDKSTNLINLTKFLVFQEEHTFLLTLTSKYTIGMFLNN